jgi:hypothetical protein
MKHSATQRVAAACCPKCRFLSRLFQVLARRPLLLEQDGLRILVAERGRYQEDRILCGKDGSG